MHSNAFSNYQRSDDDEFRNINDMFIYHCLWGNYWAECIVQWQQYNCMNHLKCIHTDAYPPLSHTLNTHTYTHQTQNREQAPKSAYTHTPMSIAIGSEYVLILSIIMTPTVKCAADSELENLFFGRRGAVSVRCVRVCVCVRVYCLCEWSVGSCVRAIDARVFAFTHILSPFSHRPLLHIQWDLHPAEPEYTAENYLLERTGF